MQFDDYPLLKLIATQQSFAEVSRSQILRGKRGDLSMGLDISDEQMLERRLALNLEHAT